VKGIQSEEALIPWWWQGRRGWKGVEAGKAAQRSMSWFTSPSLMSSSLTSSSTDLVISSSVKNGEAFVDEDLISLKDEKVTPVGLCHYRVPGNNNPKVWHHYAVVAVRLRGLPGKSFLTNSTTLIVFEKGKLKDVEKLKVSGKVTVEIFKQTRLREAKLETLLEEELEDCQEILMKDLLELLTTERTLPYSLWKNNCWKYVYDCQEAMLCKFAELPGTSPACKESLEKVRQKLSRPSLLSHVFHWKTLLVTLFQAFLSSSAHQGRILVKFIKFAFKEVKAMSVKGLGPSLSYQIPYILEKLKKLGLKGSAITAAKALLGSLNLKGVAIGALLIFILFLIWALIIVAYKNTSHPWEQWFP